MEILMGTLTKTQVANELAVQAVWLVVLALICIVVTKRGRNDTPLREVEHEVYSAGRGIHSCRIVIILIH